MEENHLIVMTKKDIETHANKKVKVFGIYSELNVSQKQTRQLFTGRVKIVLEDESLIILETDYKGIRSKEEIIQFKDRKVSVTGTLLPHSYAWGDSTAASIIGPCLIDILQIDEINE